MQNSTIKGYFQYLCKSNKNLIILIMIAGFICIPFTVFITYSPGMDPLASFVALCGGSYFLGFALACLLPIYIFKYLYNKKSCDLYYSLPITKKDLFIVNVVFSLVVTILPIIIYGVVTIIGITVVLGAHDLPIAESFASLLLLVLYIGILNALMSFLSVKCNNLIDALFIGGCFLIIPFIIMGCIQVFINAQFGQFMLGNSGYTQDLNIINYLITLLSMPYVAAVSIMCIFSNVSGLFSWWYVVYWTIIGLICFYSALKYYIEKDNEESENRTTTKIGYPLVIMTLTTCMILAALTSNGTTTIILLTIIFMMYMTVTFISRRSIKIDVKTIVIYVGLLCICFGFSELFQSTKGFHLVHETPAVSSVKAVNMDVSFTRDDAIISQLEAEIKTENDERVMKGIYVKSKDDDGYKRLLKLHEDVLAHLEKVEKYTDSYYENEIGYIIFKYQLKNGKSVVRNYTLTKEIYKEVYEVYYKELEKDKNSYKIELY